LGNDLIKLRNHLLGFTNSQALACSNSVKPYAHPRLLVLLQIISPAETFLLLLFFVWLTKKRKLDKNLFKINKIF
jgi:hypothetical protein